MLDCFKQLTDKHGFAYLEKMLAQNPMFVHGAWDFADHVAALTQRKARGLPAADGGDLKAAAADGGEPGHELAAVPRRAAETPSHPEHRTDIAPALKGIFDCPNGKPVDLGTFMSDRTALDRYQSRVILCVGDVQSANSADPDNVFGLYLVDQQGTQGA